MPDTFSNWRSADRQWMERNHDLIPIVYQWFLEHGKWPEVEQLQRALHQTGHRDIDVRAVADSKPSLPGQLMIPVRPAITLGARYLLQEPEAQSMLGLIVKATELAVRTYLMSGTTPAAMVVKSTDPSVDRFFPPTVDLFPEFMTTDYPNAFAGGSMGDEWALNVNQATVIFFENAASPQQYVERQFEIIEGWAKEQDQRLGITASTQQCRAFIVMPFEEPWSEESYGFMMRAVSAQGGALEATRADQIDRTGRITDQIIEELRTCDVIIADITGGNPNVTWELGYAYAQAKPCAIIMRKGSAAPFDIYDHRRVDYSNPPTGEEEERLTAILRNAIGR